MKVIILSILCLSANLTWSQTVQVENRLKNSCELVINGQTLNDTVSLSLLLNTDKLICRCRLKPDGGNTDEVYLRNYDFTLITFPDTAGFQITHSGNTPDRIQHLLLKYHAKAGDFVQFSNLEITHPFGDPNPNQNWVFRLTE